MVRNDERWKNGDEGMQERDISINHLDNAWSKKKMSGGNIL